MRWTVRLRADYWLSDVVASGSLRWCFSSKSERWVCGSSAGEERRPMSPFDDRLLTEALNCVGIVG
jgi:hypothetical protein